MLLGSAITFRRIGWYSKLPDWALINLRPSHQRRCFTTVHGSQIFHYVEHLLFNSWRHKEGVFRILWNMRKIRLVYWYVNQCLPVCLYAECVELTCWCVYSVNLCPINQYINFFENMFHPGQISMPDYGLALNWFGRIWSFWGQWK